MNDIVSDAVLDRAFAWLGQRRLGYPPDADVWAFRRNWPEEKARLRAALLQGDYEIGLRSRVTRRDGEALELWSTRDAVVLKALALVLAQHLPASAQCYHLAGHGGAKAAVREALAHLPSHRFVMKTDVKSYFASMDHGRLLDRLARHIPDHRVLNLITQAARGGAEQAGHYWFYTQGIALGCPLSPVLGAFYLYDLDMAMQQRGVTYLRFVDDVLVLAPTRWKLRRTVRRVNEVLAGLGLAKAPNKTFIGRIAKGFTWLGYLLGLDGLRLAPATWERFAARLRRLYEQHADADRMGAYVRHWGRWARAGLGAVWAGVTGTLVGEAQGLPQAALDALGGRASAWLGLVDKIVNSKT